MSRNLSVGATYAQTSAISGQCAVTAVPTQVRAEGLTERTGDILISCSGSLPGAVLAGNLQVFLPVGISNRVDSGNVTTDAMVSVDYGSGFVPTGVAGRISNQLIAFNALNLTVPPSGKLNLKVSNIRAAVYQLGVTIPQQIQAQLSFSSTASILVNQSKLTVAYAQPGLFITMSDRGNITCAGSPSPSTITLSGLFSAKTAFASTRVTEGFAASFQPRAAGDDAGTRFLVKYSGFPAGTHLYLPDFVAGSDAAAPTSGGDLGVPQAAGQYASGSGTLLLARVQFANADGSGGIAVATPAGSGAVTLESAGEVPLTGGAGFAVYEVVDANPSLLETAQFPAFVGLGNVTAPAVAHESVTFAPVSTQLAASTAAPVPRFAGTHSIVGLQRIGRLRRELLPEALGAGEPGATHGHRRRRHDQPTRLYRGQQLGRRHHAVDRDRQLPDGLRLAHPGLQFRPEQRQRAVVGQAAGAAGGDIHRQHSDRRRRPGGDVCNSRDSGGIAGAGSSRQRHDGDRDRHRLRHRDEFSGRTGGYGQQSSQCGDFRRDAAGGRIAGDADRGTNLAGKNGAVTFDDLPATLLYTGASQINLQVPAGLAAKTSASLVVNVDGVTSVPQTVVLAPAWPAVFANGVLNQDNSVNGTGNGAKGGSILQIFTTGVPAGATVSVLIGDRKDLIPLYAGAAPDVPGVQQINVAVPEGVSAGGAQLSICALTGGSSIVRRHTR